MSTIPLPAVRAADLEPFGRWLSRQNYRRTGRDLAAATIATRQQHVATVLSMPVFAGYVASSDRLARSGALLADRAECETLVDDLLERCTSGTVRQYLFSLQAFAGWLKATGVMAGSFALDGCDFPAANPQPAINIYSPDQLTLMVSAARGRGLRWWALISYLVDTGRRIGETLALDWASFQLDARPVPYVVLPTTKAGDAQYVPLTDRLVRQVFTAENMETLKSTTHNGRGQPWARDPAKHPFPWASSSAVLSSLESFCADIGVPYTGFHSLRHTFATQRLAEGVPLNAVASLLGHRNVSTTARFYDHCSALSHALRLPGYLATPSDAGGLTVAGAPPAPGPEVSA